MLLSEPEPGQSYSTKPLAGIKTSLFALLVKLHLKDLKGINKIRKITFISFSSVIQNWDILESLD